MDDTMDDDVAREDEHVPCDCADCMAKNIALDLFGLAILNALSAGCDAQDVFDRCTDVLDECCGADEVGLKDVEAAGQA